MLVPFLHFNGNCKEAILLYVKAFDAVIDMESIDYMPDGINIAHASMKIHGVEVFLNDGLNFINSTFGCMYSTAHFAVTFNSVDELLDCYEILKTEDTPAPFHKTPYSKLVGSFMDKFGVLWGFMVAA